MSPPPNTGSCVHNYVRRREPETLHKKVLNMRTAADQSHIKGTSSAHRFTSYVLQTPTLDLKSLKIKTLKTLLEDSCYVRRFCGLSNGILSMATHHINIVIKEQAGSLKFPLSSYRVQRISPKSADRYRHNP